MKFTKSDLIKIENLMKITRQGQFSLTGEQALAFSDCIKWLVSLHIEATKQIDEENKPLKFEEVKSPVVEVKPKAKKKD